MTSPKVLSALIGEREGEGNSRHSPGRTYLTDKTSSRLVKVPTSLLPSCCVREMIVMLVNGYVEKVGRMALYLFTNDTCDNGGYPIFKGLTYTEHLYYAFSSEGLHNYA